MYYIKILIKFILGLVFVLVAYVAIISFTFPGFILIAICYPIDAFINGVECYKELFKDIIGVYSWPIKFFNEILDEIKKDY